MKKKIKKTKKEETPVPLNSYNYKSQKKLMNLMAEHGVYSILRPKLCITEKRYWLLVFKGKVFEFAGNGNLCSEKKKHYWVWDSKKNEIVVILEDIYFYPKQIDFNNELIVSFDKKTNSFTVTTFSGQVLCTHQPLKGMAPNESCPPFYFKGKVNASCTVLSLGTDEKVKYLAVLGEVSNHDVIILLPLSKDHKTSVLRLEDKAVVSLKKYTHVDTFKNMLVLRGLPKENERPENKAKEKTLLFLECEKFQLTRWSGDLSFSVYGDYQCIASIKMSSRDKKNSLLKQLIDGSLPDQKVQNIESGIFQ